MSWALIDDKILTHPKMQFAESVDGDSAWTLWSKALVYVRLHQLDGLVPGFMVPSFVRHKSPSKIAATLVKAGLWTSEGDDYRIHDYHHINETKEQLEAKRQEARERMQKRRGVRANKSEQPANSDEPVHESSPGVRECSDGVRDPKPNQTKPNRTEVKKQHTHEGDGGTSTYIPPAPRETTTNPDAAKILDRLRAHPELLPVATVGVAERLAGFRMAGKTLDAILLSVDELADKATAAVIANAPWNTEHMAAKAIAFGRNASPPRPEAPKPGQAMTPDQVLAEQRRRGVQQGTGGAPRAVRREWVPDER